MMMTSEELDGLIEGLESKAEKVRALANAGVPTAEIGRHLGLKYQHVYNVLLRAKIITRPADRASAASPASDADAEIVLASVDRNGAVKLPPAVMERYGVRAGEQLFCRATTDGLLLMSRESALEHLRQAARSRMPEEAALFEALLSTPQAIRSPGP